MVEYEQTQQLLTEMGLTTAAALLDAKLDEAARKEDMTYLGFLNQLLIEEEKARKRRSQQTRLKLSRLPFRKTLEEFDFDFQPSIDRDQINEPGTLVFAERNENVLFPGPPGVGKTHLAVALAMRAIENGKTVYFTSLTRMIRDLEKADLQGHLDRRWKIYMRPSILIVDEVGYYSMDRRAAELFFQIVCRRYETGSIILTSNKHFSEWGDMMSDTVIATATLDRLLHHAHIVNIRGKSYRMKDRFRVGEFDRR